MRSLRHRLVVNEVHCILIVLMSVMGGSYELLLIQLPQIIPHHPVNVERLVSQRSALRAIPLAPEKVVFQAPLPLTVEFLYSP